MPNNLIARHGAGLSLTLLVTAATLGHRRRFGAREGVQSGRSTTSCHRFQRATSAEAAPGVYVTVIGGLALVALWRWPETAFRKLD